MAKQLLGKEVNEALVAALQTRTAALNEKGITPTDEYTAPDGAGTTYKFVDLPLGWYLVDSTAGAL